MELEKFEDFQQKYRSSALKYHPDKDRSEESKVIMQRLNECKEIYQFYLDLEKKLVKGGIANYCLVSADDLTFQKVQHFITDGQFPLRITGHITFS